MVRAYLTILPKSRVSLPENLRAYWAIRSMTSRSSCVASVSRPKYFLRALRLEERRPGDHRYAREESQSVSGSKGNIGWTRWR